MCVKYDMVAVARLFLDKLLSRLAQAWQKLDFVKAISVAWVFGLEGVFTATLTTLT
jgi:hypothetical protein